MLKNVILAASVAAFLSSCTAETYVEFDNLMLEINGLEIDSSVGIDSEAVTNTTPPSNTFNLTPALLTGDFTKEPVENLWHKVTITTSSSGKLYWNNFAGVSWTLEIKDGKLYSGPDCPYGIQAMDLVIDKNEVSVIYFNNEPYSRK